MPVLSKFLHSDPDPAVVFLKKLALGATAVGFLIFVVSLLQFFGLDQRIHP
jgi:hypothetical protein